MACTVSGVCSARLGGSRGLGLGKFRKLGLKALLMYGLVWGFAFNQAWELVVRESKALKRRIWRHTGLRASIQDSRFRDSEPEKPRSDAIFRLPPRWELSPVDNGANHTAGPSPLERARKPKPKQRAAAPSAGPSNGPSAA